MKAAAPGRFGFWWRRGEAGSSNATLPPIPEGKGPLLAVYVPAGHDSAALQICAACRQQMPGLRVATIGADSVKKQALSKGTFARFLDQGKPFAVLVLGADMPAAIITAAAHAKIAVVLANLHLGVRLSGWGWQSAVFRSLLNGARKLFVLDKSSQQLALRNGISPEKIVVTGPITDIRPPLPYNEAERSEIAGLLRGRNVWLAAAVPESEEIAVLNAHIALLRLSHRAFLFFVPADPQRQAAVAEMCENLGLGVALRGLDDGEPADGQEVLIADGVAELGLWYRLAPVSFIGGTISGDISQSRPPFEAAAMGSAIVHGNHFATHTEEWQPLLDAQTTRMVRDGADLADAICALSQPVTAANLANTAWSVSTSGAVIAARIAAELHDVARDVAT